jgi:hypothetical protein
MRFNEAISVVVWIPLGYQSPSQFSREYRGLFDRPQRHDMVLWDRHHNLCKERGGQCPDHSRIGLASRAERCRENRPVVGRCGRIGEMRPCDDDESDVYWRAGGAASVTRGARLSS